MIVSLYKLSLRLALAMRPTRLGRALAGGVGAAALLAGALCAQNAPTFFITIKGHQFDPSEVHVPAGKPSILVITNADDGPEEFDSTDLRVEKVIQGGAKGAVWLRPLSPGSYSFMGEYHADTAKGKVIAELSAP